MCLVFVRSGRTVPARQSEMRGVCIRFWLAIHIAHTTLAHLLTLGFVCGVPCVLDSAGAFGSDIFS